MVRFLDVRRCLNSDALGQTEVGDLPFVELKQIGDGEKLTMTQYTEHGLLVGLLFLRQFFIIIYTLVPVMANGIEVCEPDGLQLLADLAHIEVREKHLHSLGRRCLTLGLLICGDELGDR